MFVKTAATEEQVEDSVPEAESLENPDPSSLPAELDEGTRATSAVSGESSVTTVDQLRRSSAQWILKVGETRALSRAAVVGIVQDVSELVADLVAGLGEEVCQVISANGVDPTSLHGLSDLFHPPSPYSLPFDGLTTFHLQLQYYKRNFSLVVSAFLTMWSFIFSLLDVCVCVCVCVCVLKYYRSQFGSHSEPHMSKRCQDVGGNW